MMKSDTVDEEGLTAEQLATYEGMAARREECLSWAKRLSIHLDDLQVFLDAGVAFEAIPPAGNPHRKFMLGYLKKSAGPMPAWMIVSGICPTQEQFSTVAERRVQLRKLYKAAVLLIRRALARREADPEKLERGIYWEPVYEVCRELGICQSKLSSYCKEFSGHSLTQVVDIVRVERVRKMMRVEVRGFVRGMKEARGACLGTGKGHFLAEAQSFLRRGEEKGEEEEGLDRWGVWKALKGARRWPEFSRDMWAQGLGFASYRRLYRACVAVFGKTPHQIEMELIEAYLNEDSGEEKVEVPDFLELSLVEIEGLVREIPHYAEEVTNG